MAYGIMSTSRLSSNPRWSESMRVAYICPILIDTVAGFCAMFRPILARCDDSWQVGLVAGVSEIQPIRGGSMRSFSNLSKFTGIILVVAVLALGGLNYSSV